MIRYSVSPENADAVREALTCPDCPRYRAVGHPVYGHGTCPTCQNGLSFWWGIEAGWHRDEPLLPAVVQQMLGTCQTCDGRQVCECELCAAQHYDLREVCPDCRDGRPLVELVTDCQRADDDTDTPCSPECRLGFVSLGVVTATELLPVADGNLSSLSRPCVAVADDGTAYLFTSNGNDDDPPAPITLLGPPDATHAIHLTGVER